MRHRLEGSDLLCGQSEVEHLAQHFAQLHQHGDRLLVLVEQVLEIEHDVGDCLREPVLQPVLHRPSSEAAHGVGGLGRLALEQFHHLGGQQIAGSLGDLVDGVLDDLQSPFDSTVEQGDAVAAAVRRGHPVEHRF